MRKVLANGLLAVVLVAAGFGLAPPAHAATIHVQEGESIQAAVDRARRGDVIVVHPGVYRESIQIRSHGITLRGAGSSRAGTVLRVPEGSPSCFGGSAGICILRGDSPDESPPVNDTHNSGFRFEGFEFSGFVSFNAHGLRVAHTTSVGGEYGVAAFGSTGVKFLYNISKKATEAGVYTGDSPRSGNRLIGNRVSGSLYGIFVRQASLGVIANNRVFGNCVGIFFLNHEGPGGSRNWVVKRNQVFSNNRFCEAEGGAPPASGGGIVLVGARDNTIRSNTVWNNRPKGDATMASGGVVLLSSKAFGGSNSSGNRIVDNTAYGNRPADIRWDGAGRGNVFQGNECGTSQPKGLCD